MDKLRKIICFNKKITVFLFGLLIIGVLFGSSMPLFLNNSDKELITNYLSDFVNNINNPNTLYLLKNGLINSFSFSFLIWILGVSIIGIPIVLFIFFSKCFILGFSITSIILNYGFKGIIFAFFYVFPSSVIDILLYLVLTSYSLAFSIKIIMNIIKKKEFNIRIAFKQYFKIFILSLIILILISLYDAFISPVILNYIFNLIHLHNNF